MTSFLGTDRITSLLRTGRTTGTAFLGTAGRTALLRAGRTTGAAFLPPGPLLLDREDHRDRLSWGRRRTALLRTGRTALLRTEATFRTAWDRREDRSSSDRGAPGPPFLGPPRRTALLRTGGTFFRPRGDPSRAGGPRLPGPGGPLQEGVEASSSSSSSNTAPQCGHSESLSLTKPPQISQAKSSSSSSAASPSFSVTPSLEQDMVMSDRSYPFRASSV